MTAWLSARPVAVLSVLEARDPGSPRLRPRAVSIAYVPRSLSFGLMKRLAVLATALLLAVSLPITAMGQSRIEIGPRVGIDAGDVEEPFVGADVRIGLAMSRIVINPTFNYYFVDDPLTYWSASGNVLYRFGVNNAVFTPYSGAGLGIYRSSIDGGGSSTDLGINALFGAEFLFGSVRPFLEAQYSPVFSEGSTTSLFSVTGGLLFGI